MLAVICILYIICNKCKQYYIILYVMYDNISLHSFTQWVFCFSMRCYITEAFLSLL